MKKMIATSLGVFLAGAIAPSAAYGLLASDESGGEVRTIVVEAADAADTWADSAALVERHGDSTQQAAFADGKISEEEYAEATQRMISCVVERGLDLETLELEWTGLAYTYVFLTEDDDSAKAEEIFDSCYFTTAAGVDTVFQTSIDPARGELLRLAAECLVDHGLDEHQLGIDEGAVPVGGVLIHEAETAELGLWAHCQDQAVNESGRKSTLPSVDSLLE